MGEGISAKLKFRGYKDNEENSYYLIVASYLDPITGERKIVKSDIYDEMLEYYLGSKDVNVYINENNEVLIDDLKIRKSIKDEGIVLNNQKEKNLIYEYYYVIEKYQKVITAVVIIGVVLMFIFLRLR